MAEKLFLLQLTLKKNSVNIARKYEEVDRLCLTYTDQIKKYMVALNNSIQMIFKALKLEGKDSTIPSVPSQIENKKLTDFFMNSDEKLQEIVEDSISSSDYLPRSSFNFLLSYFHYFWTDKYCNAFADFVAKMPQVLAQKLAFMLIFQPNVQMFVISALRPVFEEIFGDKPDYELAEIFYQNAIKYAPMLPQFARKVFSSIDSPGHVFWLIVEPFLRNYALFGLCDAEMSLFINVEEFNSLFDTFSEYFNSDSCSIFMEKIISCAESLCVIPKEEKLTNIFPDYVPFTLVSDFTTFNNIEECKGSVKKTPFFVCTDVAKPKCEVEQTEENHFLDLVRKFLLRAALIKVPTEQPKAFDYFQVLSELSSVYGDPDLEDLLDCIASAMPDDMTIENIEDKISESLERESKSEKENPLVHISSYSAQQAYVARLTDYFNEFETNSNSAKILDDVEKFMEAQNIGTVNSPEEFKKVYEELSQKFGAKSPEQLKVIYTYLEAKIGIYSTLQADVENVEQDIKLRTYIASIGTELVNQQKQEWLEPFKADKTKLLSFNQKIISATKTPSPIQAALKLHAAFHDLTGLLMIAEIGEIGADQIIPFAIVAIANVNPSGIYTLGKFLENYVSPLFGGKSPLDHAVEYSVIQFLSTIKAFQDYSSSA